MTGLAMIILATCFPLPANKILSCKLRVAACMKEQVTKSGNVVFAENHCMINELKKQVAVKTLRRRQRSKR